MMNDGYLPELMLICHFNSVKFHLPNKVLKHPVVGPLTRMKGAL